MEALPGSLLGPLKALNLSASVPFFGSHQDPLQFLNNTMSFPARQNAMAANSTGTKYAEYKLPLPVNSSQPLVAVQSTAPAPDDGNQKYKLPLPLNGSQPFAATGRLPPLKIIESNVQDVPPEGPVSAKSVKLHGIHMPLNSSQPFAASLRVGPWRMREGRGE